MLAPHLAYRTQDENASVTPLAVSKLGGQRDTGHLLGAKSFGKAALGTQRRALVNITNKTGLSKAGDSAGAGKTPALAAKASVLTRRALGDITNATPARQHAPLSAGKVSAPRKAAGPQEQQQRVGPVSTAVDIAGKAEGFAAEGVEQRAGAGWEQLEAEQQANEEAEIAARLATVLKAVSGVSYLNPYKQARRKALENLQLQEVVAPPSPISDGLGAELEDLYTVGEQQAVHGSRTDLSMDWSLETLADSELEEDDIVGKLELD